MPRVHALLDLLVGFDPDRSLVRTLDLLAQSAHAAQTALEVPPEIMQTLTQCLDEGATAHRLPGAIDAIALTPEAACLLMEHGAVPGQGWVQGLLRWMERSTHAGNDLPDAVHPQTASQWLRRAIRQSITLRPDLDWLCVYKSEVSNNREVFIDRLSLRDGDVVRHLRQARVAAGLPLVPLNAPTDTYTQLLADVLDEYPRHRRLWQDLGTDQVARDLLEKGANPGRIWPAPEEISRDDPFLVRTLFKDPALAVVLLDKGACVSEQVIDGLGRALVDRQRRLIPGSDARRALQALLDRMPLSMDPDTRPVEADLHRSLGQVIDQVMPGVLDPWRARRKAYLLDGKTPACDDPSPLRRL